MDETNDKSPFPTEMDDEDALLKDLNLNAVDGAYQDLEKERPLPKKVELDIDDLIIEDEEPPQPEIPLEKPPLPEVSEEEEAPPEPKAPKKRWSKTKLIILAAAAVLIISLVTLPVVYIYMDEEKPEQPEVDVVTITPIQMEPFIINFPTTTPEVIAELKITVSFPDDMAKTEFTSQLLRIRDLIFRFIQGQGPSALESPDAKTRLQEDLTNIINAVLSQGRIENIAILEFKSV